jgi:hypothetical protein
LKILSLEVKKFWSSENIAGLWVFDCVLPGRVIAKQQAVVKKNF